MLPPGEEQGDTITELQAWAFYYAPDRVKAKIDVLATRLREAEENLRVREASQIPMIPRAAQEKMERLERDLAALREALEKISERALSHDGIPDRHKLVGIKQEADRALSPVARGAA